MQETDFPKILISIRKLTTKNQWKKIQTVRLRHSSIYLAILTLNIWQFEMKTSSISSTMSFMNNRNSVGIEKKVEKIENRQYFSKKFFSLFGQKGNNFGKSNSYIITLSCYKNNKISAWPFFRILLIFRKSNSNFIWKSNRKSNTYCKIYIYRSSSSGEDDDESQSSVINDGSDGRDNDDRANCWQFHHH